MELYSVIKRPLVTEKSTSEREERNKYIFEVDPRANKIEIGQAVEKLFKVKVLDVRAFNVPAKKNRMGRFGGKNNDWKKAIVTVAPGSSIEIFENV
jgi:large subunit ribosomal protein L23